MEGRGKENDQREETGELRLGSDIAHLKRSGSCQYKLRTVLSQRAQRSKKSISINFFKSRSKISISTSQIPHKKRAAVGGSL